jgi:hypothetical protein
MTVRPQAVGLAFGLFLAAFHALWALLVWAGVAQSVMDFVFRLHMITPPYSVGPFSLATAAALVAVTGTIGFLSGWCLGAIWNRVARATRDGSG